MGNNDENKGRQQAVLELPGRLSALRKKSGCDQRSVAKAVGVAASALSAFENGQRVPSLEQAIALANYYGVTLNALCGMEEEKADTAITRMDVMKAISTLCESKIPVAIERGRAMPGELIYGENRVFGGVDVLTLRLYSDWLMEFANKYRNLLTLYVTGDIDQEVLDSWKAKRFAEGADKIAEDAFDELPWG